MNTHHVRQECGEFSWKLCSVDWPEFNEPYFIVAWRYSAFIWANRIFLAAELFSFTRGGSWFVYSYRHLGCLMGDILKTALTYSRQRTRTLIDGGKTSWYKLELHKAPTLTFPTSANGFVHSSFVLVGLYNIRNLRDGNQISTSPENHRLLSPRTPARMGTHLSSGKSCRNKRLNKFSLNFIYGSVADELMRNTWLLRSNKALGGLSLISPLPLIQRRQNSTRYGGMTRGAVRHEQKN